VKHNFVTCNVKGARGGSTSQKGAGSVPDVVIGILLWHNPSGRTMALVEILPSNVNEYQEWFLWGKGGLCVRLTTWPTLCVNCLEIW
jgi:hypothetical protein